MFMRPSEDFDKPQLDTSSKGPQPGTCFDAAKGDVTASGSDILQKACCSLKERRQGTTWQL